MAKHSTDPIARWRGKFTSTATEAPFLPQPGPRHRVGRA
jgi:hypothetical protein